ncbi:MAG: OmpA family protein [Azospirillaceae bacterium]|nr:OmpA family protein [Azospirillaceae bacterium]
MVIDNRHRPPPPPRLRDPVPETHSRPMPERRATRWQTVAPEIDTDQEIWLLSYSDMVTLLFAVFVMMLAITLLKEQLPRVDRPPPSTVAAPGMPVPPHAPPNPDPSPAIPTDTESNDPALLPGHAPSAGTEMIVATPLEEQIRRLGLPDDVSVQVQNNSVAITIGDRILFASAQADLSAPGRAVLTALAPTLSHTRGTLQVEGHTDNIPIIGSRFPSNWELSAARAAAVVRVLIDQGVAPGRLTVIGHGDTQPIADNGNEAGRSRNRRVTLTLLNPTPDAGFRAPP